MTTNQPNPNDYPYYRQKLAADEEARRHGRHDSAATIKAAVSISQRRPHHLDVAIMQYLSDEIHNLRHVPAHRRCPDAGGNARPHQGERVVRLLRFRHQTAEWGQEGTSPHVVFWMSLLLTFT